MTPDATNDFQLVLSRCSSGGRIRVDLDSFLEFNADVDYELESLMARWSDFITADSLAREKTDFNPTVADPNSMDHSIGRRQ